MTAISFNVNVVIMGSQSRILVTTPMPAHALLGGSWDLGTRALNNLTIVLITQRVPHTLPLWN